MPNWCQNHVEVRGPLHTLLNIRSAFEGERGDFSNVLCPQPPDLQDAPDILHWRLNNWGTKSILSNKETGITLKMNEHEEKYCLIFSISSAYSPPLACFLAYKERQPEVSIRCFFHEANMSFCGVYYDGESQRVDYLDNRVYVDCATYAWEKSKSSNDL